MTGDRKAPEREPNKPEATEPEPIKTESDIVGTWIRDQPDDEPYPDEITFESDGIYSGKKAPGSRLASKLDVGVFDRIDETSIRMSTSTDRLETFAVDVSDDALKLVDEDGKELSYTRQSEDAPAAEAATPEDDVAGGSPSGDWKP